jgi:hypothetical protein
MQIINLMINLMINNCFFLNLVDACLANPCYNGGTCVTMYETDAMYTCQCPAGCYGRNCEACIGCSSIRCQNGGQCITNPNGSYYCSCPYGYTGTFCEQCKILIYKL